MFATKRVRRYTPITTVKLVDGLKDTAQALSSSNPEPPMQSLYLLTERSYAQVSFHIAPPGSPRPFSHFITEEGVPCFPCNDVAISVVGVMAISPAMVTQRQREVVEEWAAMVTLANPNVALYFGPGLAPFDRADTIDHEQGRLML